MAVDGKKEASARANLLFCFFLFVMLVVFFVASLGYRPGTRLAPLVVIVPFAFMLAGQVVMVLKDRKRNRSRAEEGPPSPTTETGAVRRGVQLFCWMILLMLLIYLVGQLAGIALFLISFLRYASKERWVLSLSLGVGVTVCLHLLFEVLLVIPLYPGILYQYVSAWFVV